MKVAVGFCVVLVTVLGLMSLVNGKPILNSQDTVLGKAKTYTTVTYFKSNVNKLN